MPAVCGLCHPSDCLADAGGAVAGIYAPLTLFVHRFSCGRAGIFGCRVSARSSNPPLISALPVDARIIVTHTRAVA